MANLYPVILILLIFEKALTKEISLTCSVEFCDDYVQKFPCPPLDPICSNPKKSLVIPSLTICNCCEHCFIFQDLGESCQVGHPGQPLPKVMCKPGTKCVAGICVEMGVPDSDFYPGYECEGENCYCAVVENNAVKKIFGTFKKNKETQNEKQCGCSTSAYYSQKSINDFLPIPNTLLPIPRCLPNGQFDPLQCINDVCGCVNKTMGDWDLTVRKVLIATLGPNNPKCFDPKRHKLGQYYTKCEKERNSLMADISGENSEESEVLLSHKVECAPDGSYARAPNLNQN